MSKITRTQLKQYLKQRSYDELVDDLLDLFSRLDVVKDYYRLRLSNEWALSQFVGCCCGRLAACCLVHNLF